MPKLRYCLGFVFDGTEPFNAKQVLLQRKLRPAWQAHKLNGIGGKVDTSLDDGNPAIAMSREFLEATGVQVSYVRWNDCGCIRGPNWEVAVFWLQSEEAFRAAQTKTDEPIGRYAWEYDVNFGSQYVRGFYVLAKAVQRAVCSPEGFRFLLEYSETKDNKGDFIA